jgi:hypothetical protein
MNIQHLIPILFLAAFCTVKAQNSVDNAAAKDGVTVNLKSNGLGLPEKSQLVTGVVELPSSNHILFILLREAKTGYTWWQYEYRPKGDFSHPLDVQDYINEFESSFWVVPDIGIAQLVDRTRLVITDMKTANIEDARRQLIAGFIAGQTNNVWPLEQHQKEINLPLIQPLGEDYFHVPGTAMPPPSPEVLALGFTDGTWTMKLESATAKTNRIAMVELDSHFKVLKATRFN